MSVNCVRLFFLAIAAALLSACASSGGSLQKAGATAEVYGMVITSDLNWSRIKMPRQELWTIDCPAHSSHPAAGHQTGRTCVPSGQGTKIQAGRPLVP